VMADWGRNHFLTVIVIGIAMTSILRMFIYVFL
jgi:multisubunit Na+/H+ antiporter MnhC subunit